MLSANKLIMPHTEACCRLCMLSADQLMMLHMNAGCRCAECSDESLKLMTSAVAVSCEADLCQVFHVWRLDVHHIEALLGVVQVPQVDSQVITGDESLLITAD